MFDFGQANEKQKEAITSVDGPLLISAQNVHLYPQIKKRKRVFLMNLMNCCRII
jgi:hypothetical protein